MPINSATTQQLAEVRALVVSLSGFYLQDPEAQLPDWFSATLTAEQFSLRLNSPDYANYIFTVDEKVVGYIAIRDTSHLFHLFVDEHHQGQGIARQLWQHVMQQHPSAVYTLRSSLFAVPVYEKLGFKATGAASSKDGIGFQPMQLST